MAEPRWRWLPRPDTPKYHLLLGAVSLLVLGPLGGITGTYMGFSLGFLVGGQVLAGILGSAVTYGYGPDGKHGANYIQTMSASVATLGSMGVLIQAMVWLQMAMPPPWVLVLYMTCIGMFGIGIGMLYTPLLVDRLKLEYPSGHAVANILRALTDPALLKRSIAKLGAGMGLGVVIPAVVDHVDVLAATRLSASNVGAGMIVGSRITVPAVMMGFVGWLLTPHLRAIGWLGEKDPFRKIGFLIGLAMIMGAAVVDISLIAVEAFRRLRALGTAPAAASSSPAGVAQPAPKGGGLSTPRLLLWVGFWGAALLVVATQLLHQPVGFSVLAMVLCVVFVLVNGISTGITDSNPISSAFVVSVMIMSGLGLRDPVIGMLAATILLVSCTIGVDMQQDRSTGWRLGSNRAMQFRYQAVGIAVGAVLCVVLAQVFMTAYPVLRIDTFSHPEAKVDRWQSAMTFKFVGAIRDLGHLPPHKIRALEIGLGLGFVIEVARKLLARSPRYRAFVAPGAAGFAFGWLVDAILLSSPYASSFGAFLDLSVSAWFGVGGVLTSVLATVAAAKAKRAAAGAAASKEVKGGGAEEVPADMSTTSLVGGGLLAGESIYALAAGIIGLLTLLN